MVGLFYSTPANTDAIFWRKGGKTVDDRKQLE